MTANSIYPNFVRIDYSSPNGQHSMTIPSVEAEPTTIGGSIYQFILRGGALPAQVEGAVNDFVDVIAPLFPTSVIFQSYTLFSMADPEATPLPIESNLLGIAGTSVGSGWFKAAQQTFTWRTDEFGIFKLVLLDAESGDNWDKITDLSANPYHEAISDYMTADVTWVAGRDGGRPNTFLQVAKTLNEKLRRSYRMN